jgi:hypothetical protein
MTRDRQRARRAGSVLFAVLVLVGCLTISLAGCQQQAEQAADASAEISPEQTAAAGDILQDGASAGQTGPGLDSSAVVNLSVRPRQTRAARGEQIVLRFLLDVDERWHLYAHEDTSFYGIELELPEESPLEDIKVLYPKGQEALFFGEKVQVLEGRFGVSLAGTVAAEAVPTTHHLRFKMAVQACDDKRCLAPAFMPVEVHLDVVEAHH